MSDSTRRARIFHRDDAVVVGSWEDVFFQRWFAPGGARSVEAMLRAHEAFVRRRPPQTTLSLSHVMGSSMRPPDEPSRAVMKEHSALLSEHVRAAATVIESSGFGSAMIRSIVSGLVLVSRAKLAHQVFSNVSEGVTFLMRHRAPGGKPMEPAAFEALYVEASAPR